MPKINNIKQKAIKGLTWGGVIAALASSVPFVNDYYILPIVREEVRVELDKIGDSKENSLSYKLAKEIGVDRDVVAYKFGKTYKAFWDGNDSLLALKKIYLTMLIAESKYCNVGIRSNIITGKLTYIHTDCIEYNHLKIDSLGGYQFFNNNNKWESCK